MCPRSRPRPKRHPHHLPCRSSEAQATCPQLFLLKNQTKAQMTNNRRNRDGANSLAMERLRVPTVSDEDARDVLRKWHFKSQRVPGEAAQIRSDTLGVTQTQAGRVNLCRVTSKHPAVFALLCRWLEDNLPREFKMSFHFTSIRIEHGSRTRPWRDQWCVGPAVTKSFGQFTGG